MSKYLIDTNILIYYFNGLIEDEKIHQILKYSFNISIISKIEFLSWKALGSNSLLKEKANEFLSYANIYSLNDSIANETIFLRQNFSIKTPDAIIAATAKVYDFILLTNNIKDFEKINIKLESIKIKL